MDLTGQGMLCRADHREILRINALDILYIICCQMLPGFFFLELSQMAVDRRDQFIRRFPDPIQGCLQLRRILAGGPACDIGEAVITGLDPVMLGNVIGNRFGFKCEYLHLRPYAKFSKMLMFLVIRHKASLLGEKNKH